MPHNLQEEPCPDSPACPLENDLRSLLVVIGGETSVSRENEHSASVEVLGAKGRCRRPGKFAK